MLYRAIGLMSGSSLDGLDIVFAELLETGGHWSFQLLETACYPYPHEWRSRLQAAVDLNARDYLLLHTDYGRYTGEAVNRFIEEKGLHYRVGLVASHGHTTFHLPAAGMTAQLGDGAAIAAATGLPVVSDLRALDVAFGGQGAPIVPIGEKLLFPGHHCFLNLGGIANLSLAGGSAYRAFDVCPANRVLNLLAEKEGLPYDANGALAAAGQVHAPLLAALDALPYYGQPFPKSLANDFGTGTVFPLVESFGIGTADALRTYAEHIARQVQAAVQQAQLPEPATMLVTGGGAFNGFLAGRLRELLQPLELVIPDEAIIQYKEALIMALIGVLRWRQEYTVLSSVTGARRESIGGAVWTGQEA